ncbi:MAG: hypothetical protein M1511_07435 [Deltaproteobacteria bacterium]|nr:hypothetical protein [Deltaproteobacteria bacterium]
MKKLMVILTMLSVILPVAAMGADYLDLDKRGKVRGRATDDGDTVRFYDKSNNPRGWYDRDTNTTFDRNNRPTGTIYDFDND